MHLTMYAQSAICNIRLWACHAPVALLCRLDIAVSCMPVQSALYTVYEDRAVGVQDWPTGEGLMPSCRFRHMEGDAMDGQLLRNADIAKADAIILGNAHDADPKDVSVPAFQKYQSHDRCCSRELARLCLSVVHTRAG